MDFKNLPTWGQYALVFVGGGALALVVRAAADLGGNRIAGLAAMMPIKIVVAWSVVGATAGSLGITQSTSGMLVGLAALLLMLVTVRWVGDALGPAALIGLAVSVWLAASIGLEYGAKFIASQRGR